MRRTARCTAATLWVTRTAPSILLPRRTGAAVARISACSVWLLRVSWKPLALQGRSDLGPVAVVGAERRGAGAVGDQPPAPVDDHHAAPDRARAAVRTSSFRARCVDRRERLGGGGRDHVGLARRLRAHLGVDAPAELERERHLERDDRQHEDIREREQQADAQA